MPAAARVRLLLPYPKLPHPATASAQPGQFRRVQLPCSPVPLNSPINPLRTSANHVNVRPELDTSPSHAAPASPKQLRAFSNSLNGSTDPAVAALDHPNPSVKRLDAPVDQLSATLYTPYASTNVPTACSHHLNPTSNKAHPSAREDIATPDHHPGTPTSTTHPPTSPTRASPKRHNMFARLIGTAAGLRATRLSPSGPRLAFRSSVGRRPRRRSSITPSGPRSGASATGPVGHRKEPHMNAQVRRKIEMATRVRDFSRAHPSGDAGYETVLTRLEGILSRTDALAAQQRAGTIAAREANARRLELRRALQFQLLHHLVRVGDVVADQRPDLAGRFRLPSVNSTHRAFLTAAKQMLATAIEERDFLVSQGLAGSFLDDFGTELTEYEETTAAANAGRRQHTGARAELEVVVAELMKLVELLDGLNRYRFRQDPDRKAAWDSARNLVTIARSKAGPPPAPPSDVAPAA